jgi:hypothetical protein
MNQSRVDGVVAAVILRGYPATNMHQRALDNGNPIKLGKLHFDELLAPSGKVV